MTVMSVNTVDYVIFALGICISLGVGIFYAFKDRNKTTLFRYHRGDGKLNALSVAISLLVTKESSIMFLGYPAEIYTHGIPYFLAAFGKAIGYLCIINVSIPLFHPLGITSIVEYLEKRHGSLALRRITACIDLLVMILYSAIVLFGASVALKAVTSINVWVLAVGLASIAVIYTSLGGIKAVVFADVIQCFAMAIPMLTILIYGTVTVGGVGNVLRLNQPSGRLNAFDFDPDPLVRNSFWALMIGNFTNGFLNVASQTTIQRLNSTRSVQEAKNVMFIFIPCYLILELLAMSEGLVAFAYFSNKGCDPLASGEISNPNQIMPIAVADMLSHIPGAAGLFFAGLCSASLSTLSSQFSSMSAIVTMEMVKTDFKMFSSSRLPLFSKLVVVVAACICVFGTLILAHVPGPLTQIAGTIVLSALGPVSGVFLLSIFTKTSVKAILIGALTGVAFGAWISLGANFSSGTKRTPWLPLGPTDNCGLFQNDVKITNTSAIYTDTTPDTIETLMSTEYILNTTAEVVTDMGDTLGQSITGLNRLYSLSFNYFALLIVSITFVIGLLSGFVFKADRADIPDTLIMPFSAVLWTFLCQFNRRKESSPSRPSEPLAQPENIDAEYMDQEIDITV